MFPRKTVQQLCAELADVVHRFERMHNNDTESTTKPKFETGISHSPPVAVEICKTHSLSSCRSSMAVLNEPENGIGH